MNANEAAGHGALRAVLTETCASHELEQLCVWVLGEVPNVAESPALVAALMRASEEQGALPAIVDSLLAIGKSLPSSLGDAHAGWDDFAGIEEGARLEDILPLRQLSEDSLGRWYSGRYAGDDVVLRVLRRSLTRDRQKVTRYLAAARLGATFPDSALISVRAALCPNDLVVVAYAPFEAQSLKQYLAGRLPLSYPELLPLLRALLEGLLSLHESGLACGALDLESLWLTGDLENPRILISDFGVHRLLGLGAPVLPAGASAPELLQGLQATPRADLYAVGVLLFELLSGKPPFEGDNAAQVGASHIEGVALELQSVASAGWVSPELSALVGRLLSKEPNQRPRNASELLDLLPRPGAGEQRISDDEFTGRFQNAYAQPWDEQLVGVLERSLDDGVEPARVAAALVAVADQISVDTQPEQYTTWRGLQLRAAGIYESAASRPSEAASIYRALLESDADDEDAGRGLERNLRKQGRHDELIEWLLERQEGESSRFVRAQRMAEIGRLYAEELDDREQALVAYVTAFEECPQEGAYAQRIEHIAGSDVGAWEKVLVDCADDVERERDSDDQLAFVRQVADWYLKKINRADLALPWYQQALVISPHDDAALAGLCGVYRKAQAWHDLLRALLARADLPTLARETSAELRVEAAEIALDKLNDATTARGLCERALNDDPRLDKASQLLATSFERTQDTRGFAALLERQAQSLGGIDKARMLSRAAEAYRDKLGDVATAERLFRDALSSDTSEVAALRGLDQLYSEQGRVGELLEVLDHQLNAAQTPRQRVTLWERQVGLYENELKDVELAARCCVHILAVEPGHSAARQRLHQYYRTLGRDAELAASLEDQLRGDLSSNERHAALLQLGDLAANKLDDLQRALSCYERAASLDVGDSQALERLHSVQQKLGDASGALHTLTRLAERGDSDDKQAARQLAVAESLLEQGDREGAIERCKRALDVEPDFRPARDKLLSIYGERGDYGAIATLLEQSIDTSAGKHERAAVLGQLARVTWSHLRDEERAFAAATQAVELDATNRDSRLVLGEIAFDDSRFAEAVAHYEHVVPQLEALAEADAQRTLSNYLGALTQSGAKEKSADVARRVLDWPGCNLVLLRRAASVLYESGTPDEAARAYRRVLAQGQDTLSTEDRIDALCRLGSAEQKGGQAAKAQASFSEALELDGESLPALAGLAAAHEAASEWDKAVEVLYRQIDLLMGDPQSELLLKIGDLAATKLKDADYAARAYLLAFEGLADESSLRRTVLAKLMQLYSGERDWGKLLQVIQRLADYVQDKSQKAKYLFTGAKVALQELGDETQAAALFDRVLDLDPLHEESLQAAMKLRRKLGDPQALKELLKKEVTAASTAQDQPRALRALDELAQVYARDLRQMDKAISTLQAACGLEPQNLQRKEVLARCYLEERARFPQEALAAYNSLLEERPLEAFVHRGLRQLYTDARNADGAWCACQTLSVLGQATADEMSFFERRRENEMFAASARVTAGEALELFLHAGADRDFTRLATLIQPSVQRVRGQTLEQLGYQPEHLLQRDERFPLVSAATYIAEILGLQNPAILRNLQFDGNLSILPSNPPCFAIGRAGLSHEYPMQAAAFVAAHELCFQMPGLGIVQLLPDHTVLKTWLLGALRIVSPTLGAGSILPAPLNEATQALHQDLAGAQRDHLVSIATKMTQGAPVDLKRWLASVELTADRLAFFFCNDLTVALEMIRAGHSAAQWVTVERRCEELIHYAVSPAYLNARVRLGAARGQSMHPMAAGASP